ncbi:MAG: DUF2520 domain-containing protein [Saprospiraceae bacterium]|nr:DUF2520 domain-containing protein [Saprospiraceae bacterium]
MKISFIGSGNVATQLALALQKIGGVKIHQIISRDKGHAKNLAMQVKADHNHELSRLKPNFDLLILAVNDDAIADILTQTPLPDNKIICHTAGSVASTVFKDMSRKYGVIYPLQTISKNKTTVWKSLPILITASDDSTEKRLTQLVKHLTRATHVITDEQRFALHVAAVFACNFSNAMMQISQKLCAENNIDFDLLKPLTQETFEKAERMGPRNAQTGPAKRGDQSVINKHLEFLKDHDLEKNLYRDLSAYIQQTYRS